MGGHADWDGRCWRRTIPSEPGLCASEPSDANLSCQVSDEAWIRRPQERPRPPLLALSEGKRRLPKPLSGSCAGSSISCQSVGPCEHDAALQGTGVRRVEGTDAEDLPRRISCRGRTESCPVNEMPHDTPNNVNRHQGGQRHGIEQNITRSNGDNRYDYGNRPDHTDTNTNPVGIAWAMPVLTYGAPCADTPPSAPQPCKPISHVTPRLPDYPTTPNVGPSPFTGRGTARFFAFLLAQVDAGHRHMDVTQFQTSGQP